MNPIVTWAPGALDCTAAPALTGAAFTCPLDKLAHISGQPQVVKSERFVTSTGRLMVPHTRLVTGESMPADTVFERVPTPHLAIAIIVTTSTHLETSALPPGQRCPIGISHNHFGIRHAYGPGHMIAEMWRGAHAPPTRWGREVVVVGVRQAQGLLGIGSAANAAVSAAEKPRPAKQGW
jgi:hypothetical protein